MIPCFNATAVPGFWCPTPEVAKVCPLRIICHRFVCWSRCNWVVLSCHKKMQARNLSPTRVRNHKCCHNRNQSYDVVCFSRSGRCVEINKESKLSFEKTVDRLPRSIDSSISWHHADTSKVGLIPGRSKLILNDYLTFILVLWCNHLDFFRLFL